MSDCLFCKIVKGEVPSEKVYENENIIGFKDIAPMAKDHFLFIHKQHSKNINELILDDPDQVIEIYDAISEFSSKVELDKTGFRVVTNIGPHGGQTVFHTHFHVLGGEQLRGFGS